MNNGMKIALAALLLVACGDGDVGPEALETKAAEETTIEPYIFGDDGYMPEDKQALFFAAIERINEAVGATIVRYEPGNYMAQGLYVNEVSEGDIAHAFRNDQGDCYILIGRPVFMGLVGSPRKTTDITVAMHETLHCLDIWHDDNPESLMYPTRIRSKEQPMTEETINLLREKWGIE